MTLASKQIHVDTATDQALVRRFAQQILTAAERDEVLTYGQRRQHLRARICRRGHGQAHGSRENFGRGATDFRAGEREQNAARSVGDAIDSCRAETFVLDAIVKRAGISQVVRNFVAVLIDKEG